MWWLRQRGGSHVSRILAKLGLRSRVQAAILAQEIAGDGPAAEIAVSGPG